MSSRLPDTEIANLSFLPLEDKRRALFAFSQPKQISGTYRPFRKVFADAVNLQFPLFGTSLHSIDLAALRKHLWLECKGNEQVLAMNIAIAEATLQYAQEHSIEATKIDVVSLSFPNSPSHDFGLDLLIRYRDRASVVFLDMRRSNGLNQNGRKFMFSALHQRFRTAYSDLSEVGLEIWRYKNNKNRTLVALTDGNEHYDFADMEADVAETYAVWSEVVSRAPPRLRAVGDGSNPFGF